MATIGQLLGSATPRASLEHPLLPNVGAIGLELELEGLPNWPRVAGWRQEADGSLRDGIEYVFDGPLGGAAAVAAITAMGQTLEQHPPVPTFRCSTHIHMDVRDFDFNKLELLMCAYVMMEGVMFDHCAFERRYSNFCTPFFVNNQMARQLVRSLRAPEEHMKFHGMGQWPKYSAMNLKPLINYGSVEFRGSHALITEGDLLGLAQRMLHLKRAAGEFDGTSLEFVQHLRNSRVEDVIQSGLREGYAPDESVMDQGYATALGIASGKLAGNVAGMRQPRFTVPEQPRRPRVTDMRVPINEEAFDRYNLFHHNDIRLLDLLRLVRSLRTINHPQGRPRLQDFFHQATFNEMRWDIVGGVNNLRAAVDQLNLRMADLGL